MVLFSSAVIILIKKRPLKAQIKHRIYILKVRPKFLAVKPTIAGPKINPEKPRVDKFDTVKEIGSVVTLIAWRITTEIKFAVNSPNKTNAGIIMCKFEVSILENKMIAPIIGK